MTLFFYFLSILLMCGFLFTIILVGQNLCYRCAECGIDFHVQCAMNALVLHNTFTVDEIAEMAKESQITVTATAGVSSGDIHIN